VEDHLYFQTTVTFLRHNNLFAQALDNAFYFDLPSGIKPSLKVGKDIP
jgi:hypothetical protein